ncbi:DUF5979 domain-containing protein [Lachnospiraceae bacterium 210521-DFI.5.20]|uniref:DUF5979 domain-containing protein n=1 Tax=Fusicatenibacter saccharivorans TaxID=1150298 RepID=A0AAE3F106_9FIRM|nr:DUF5979 domain-containing protein [Fusicatenibacter saccharivorans]MCB6301573.1 DUF5979 domain-containing protein [Lachnospiraceae bacterium 210521-DFI.5.20]MCG4764874.1 DUF5979 domain-containing protein [Fusicatenibacter saccharivorans]
MRHNIWKKYLKIVCSCILILSICCLSLNVVEASDAIVKMESDSQETEDFISDIENQETEPEILADDEQLSESEQILEPENDPEHPAETEDSADQITDMDAPEQISVQSLEEELLAVAENGEEASTDRVEYVDVNGNPIAGAPSVIKFGAIADHKELSIEGRHFEFKSAKVNGKNCVYIGKYNDTIYYSTDGVIAIKLEEAQKLTMMYQEYYLVSIEEVVPDNCTPGTITQKNGSLDVPLDISNSIRVNAGENFMISVTPGTDTSKANDPRAKRFKIASVVSQNGATITQENGDEYKATYSINVVKDDKITITYEEQSVYRITINTKDINGEEYINIAHSVAKGWQYLEGQDKIMWTFTPDKVSEMSGYELDIPAFHTNRGYRVINMVVNGASIQSTSGSGGREVPINKGDTVSSAPRNLDLTTEMTNSYTSKKDDEKDCSYEYTISLKVRTGKFEDYNFTLVPYKEEHGRQAVTVRLLTDGSRNGEGLDVVMWDYEKQALVPIKDNQTVDMDPVTYEGSKKTRQVRIFFAKPKAGYTYDAGQAGQITGVSYGRPHGADQTLDGRKSDANAGNINDMTATSLKSGKTSYIIYDNQWQAAKEAAIKGGYTRYIAWGGAKPLDLDNDWYLYDATFMVVSSGIYVHYNSGAGMGVLPNNVDVKNIPDNPETRSNNKTPMHSYGKNLETGKGTRAIGTTFIMGEGWAEPTCEGYEFIGWKLKNKDGKLSQETYSNGELFTISDENYGYANNTDLPVFASNNFTGYQIVAQWKKTAKKEVKVEHYLKIPDGKEKLEKTTSGTISFSADGESVKAFANPEPDGTFPGYVFDESDKQNTLVMDVTNNASSEPVILRLYYKPTVLHVSKTVEGYNQEPNKEFTFTLTATPPAGADQGTSQIKDGQIYITKGSKAKAIPLSFANNQATFTLKKDESVKINCLPTGWSYKVSEEDPGKNYKTTYKINNGSATDGRDVSYEMDKETDIAFINKSTMEPPVTGRTLANNGLMVLMFFVLAISMVGMVFFKRINKKN